jgi:hypothetical protein
MPSCVSHDKRYKCEAALITDMQLRFGQILTHRMEAETEQRGADLTIAKITYASMSSLELRATNGELIEVDAPSDALPIAWYERNE